MKYNPKRDDKLWFRAKYFGWGWFPITWQGWLTLLLYVAAIYESASVYTHHFQKDFRPEWFETLVFAVAVLVYSAIFIKICYLRGEKPGWRWGLPKSQDEPFNQNEHKE